MAASQACACGATYRDGRVTWPEPWQQARAAYEARRLASGDPSWKSFEELAPSVIAEVVLYFMREADG